MKNLLIILFILSCAASTASDTMAIKTPTIQCSMCKQTIESNLSSLNGVKSTTVDLINYQTVIQYNPNRLNLTDLETAISQIGYQANGVKADSIAYEKLHLCCRLPKDRK